jgi:hypothetical protein
MAGEIAYKLTADEAQALQAVARLSREFGLNETAIKKAADAAKELDRTQQQMGREAQRVFEATRTPLEQQLAQLQKLDELYKANKIDAETYGRAAQQIADKQAEAYKQVADAQKNAFGEQAKAALQSYASTANLIGNTISLISDRMKAIVELRKEAAASDRSAEMSEGSLAEVAGGDPEKYKALVKQSRGIAATAGMDRNRAAALIFAAASAGSLDQVDTFAQLHGQGIVSDPEQLMRATQTIQTAMGKGNGSLRDITSKLLAAGEHSPQKIAQLGPAAALAGVNAQSAGVNVDELLSAVAVESKATGDSSIAATMQKSLQKTLAALKGGKPGEGGIETDEEGHILDQKAQALRNDARTVLAKSADKSLMGQLHAIEGMKLDPQQMQKLFGRQEGLMAYQLLLRNEGEFKQAVGDVGAAAGKDLTGRVLSLPGADAQAAGAKAIRVQEENAKVSLAGSQIGVQRNIDDAIYAKLEADLATGKIKPGRFTSAEGEIANLQAFKADPLMRQGELRRQVQEKHALDDNPELYAQYVQARGGESKVFPQAGNFFDNGDTKELAHFREVTKDLRDAAGNLKAAGQARPTLSPPNIDK